MLFLLASSLLLQQCRFGLAVDAIAPQLDVIPYPSGVALGAGASIVDPNEFVMTVGECSHDCDVLDRAVERYMKTIFKAPGSTGTVFRLSIFEDRINTTLPVGVVDKLSGLVIKTTSKKAVELQLGIDESYELTVPGAGDAVLTAHTVWGALRGLETFAQIVQYQAQPAIDTGAAAEPESGFYVNWTPLAVQDAPRFPWRGVLIDSARHYISVPMLRKTIDSMAAMKLNTLHWHIVDAESFPFVSEEFPELQRRATYHSSASYSPSTIRSLVKYARDRGVRVLPEFDTPGHTAAVGQAYPDLIADCYAWMVQHYDDNLRWPYFNNVALDVTKDTTLEFVRTVVGEMAGLFPDSFFHIGGDEVDQDCWAAVPSIQEYMRDNGYATENATSGEFTYDYTGLQGAWASYVQELTTAAKKEAVVWEESFTLGFDLAANTVVQVWLPDDGSDVVKRIVQSGRRVVLSNGWYLDRQAPTCDADLCKTNWMWMYSGRDMYAVEPLAPSPSGWVPTDEEAALILGGEAASWGESVDDKNFDERLWSRTPGIAERLWSDASHTDPWLLQPRLSSLACKMARRGVNMADAQPAFCDYYTQDL